MNEKLLHKYLINSWVNKNYLSKKSRIIKIIVSIFYILFRRFYFIYINIETFKNLQYIFQLTCLFRKQNTKEDTHH